MGRVDFGDEAAMAATIFFLKLSNKIWRRWWPGCANGGLENYVVHRFLQDPIASSTFLVQSLTRGRLIGLDFYFFLRVGYETAKIN